MLIANVLPTILLVHGAWHTPAFYAPLVTALQARNYETICLPLPSCSNTIPPKASLPEDVALIRNEVSSLVNKNKEVVAVLHSYGGVVGTDALYGFSIAERKKNGKKGGLKSMVYMSAFVPQKGQSLAGIFGGSLPPFIEVKDEENLLVVPDPGPVFYNDLPTDESDYWTKKLVVHPKSAQFTPVTHEAFREVPVHYLLCEKDAGLVPEVQQMMIDQIVKAGVNVTVERLGGSHSPFLSMPQSTAEQIDKIAKA